MRYNLAMAIPDFQTLMLPLLALTADGAEHRSGDYVDALAQQFNLTEDERAQRLPSGRARLFYNRVAWAKTHMKRAGLLDSPSRGRIKITPIGQSLLAENPGRIDMRLLMRFPAYAEFRSRRRNDEAEPGVATEPGETANMQTPEETLEAAYQVLRRNLAAELLLQVMSASPAFFEQLVVELLLNMGYGGSRHDAGRAIGGSGDGGIDGIINEDRLGLDVIYIQAKRWEGPVGRPEIQQFVGALQGRQAKKGIFITTSTFAKPAREYASRVESKLVLIDGERLAELMIDFDVGTSTQARYEVKKIDLDYFVEE